ncbi:UNVERIFIED_ORG: catechol 2,3-dioxygenase-like lactoylglutathione lyase family enzyme [Xanthobacter viscosus]|uniref:Drug:proton antiporter n=1 Tax=Xanthobacter autotrophicus TaxID=280 RepID=A0A6C1KNW2_XANAU|nr:VOC family protein [Xanthobacter autotrophicus]TLX41086.1 drug:proton antiporter [Xanthobacter autotrophicus]
MTETNNLLLYVADPEASGRFYAGLLGLEAVEVSPTFVLLMLRSGLALGLWKASGVEPVPTASGGGSEMGFKVARAADVDATYAAWLTRGARIALPPTDLDFGRSFVALDPDGHRLRVYALADAA